MHRNRAFLTLGTERKTLGRKWLHGGVPMFGAVAEAEAKRHGGEGLRNTAWNLRKEQFRGITTHGFWMQKGKMGVPQKSRLGDWQ